MDDLISRQAVIKEVWKESMYQDHINLRADIAERIRALPTKAQRTQSVESVGWIPVSERMPKEREWVLATICGAVEPYIEELRYFDEKFFTKNAYRMKAKVTAWMPLIKPYKGEEVGQKKTQESCGWVD